MSKQNNTNGIYGIYSKSGTAYSSLNLFDGKLIGSVLATDNSSIVLYKNKFNKLTFYI
jgi:hypothetical protein